ncbi:MAG: hypothetical protein J6Q84_01600 [Kiritimatiellae bacterium]|nr:hypothetical protein [Kiritimatiellia bacterium]
MGWNGSDRANNSPKNETPKLTRKLRALPYAICALVALFGAIVLYFFLSKPESAPIAQTDTPKKRTPAPKASTHLVKKTEKPIAAPKKEKPPFVKKPGTMQTPDGRVLTFPVPAPGEFRTVHSHGAVYKCDHEGNWVDITPKPVFDNAFEENLIGMNLQDGNFIPGMLMGLDKAEVMKMLRKPVTINPDDSEEVIRKKTAAAEVKELALDYMETTGASFDDFVMEMRQTATIQKGLTASTLKDIVGFLKKGDAKSAALYRDTLNQKFRELGLPDAKIPKHINDIIDAHKNSN